MLISPSVSWGHRAVITGAGGAGTAGSGGTEGFSRAVSETHSVWCPPFAFSHQAPSALLLGGSHRYAHFTGRETEAQNS